MVNKDSKGMRRRQGAPPEDFMRCMQGQRRGNAASIPGSGKHRANTRSRTALRLQRVEKAMPAQYRDNILGMAANSFFLGAGGVLGCVIKAGCTPMGTPRETTEEGGSPRLAAPRAPPGASAQHSPSPQAP